MPFSYTNEIFALLQAFKNLTKLSLIEIDCSPDKNRSLGNLRGTLNNLEVHKCGLACPRDFLMCDSKHCDEGELDVALSQISIDERTNQPLPAKEVSSKVWKVEMPLAVCTNCHSVSWLIKFFQIATKVTSPMVGQY